MTDFLDVSDTTPRIAYVATASQTAFTVPFAFHDEAHLDVYQNDVLKTISTHYTVTGEDDEDGGAVTLVTGATVSDSIVIVRSVPYEVTTHIPLSGPLDIAALNIQYSLLVMMMQQLEAVRIRSLYQPDSDVDDFDELPTSAVRANQYLAFDASGQPRMVSTVTGVGAVTAFAQTLVDDTTASEACETLGVSAGKLVWSVSASALTVTLKSMAGNDPSVLKPVLVRVRDATATGDINDFLIVTAALSVTISSGSTLATSNNTPFRLWAVLFNDGGTPRLGVINCVSSGNILNIGGWQVATSTAEGGAGAADSGHVFYTGTAVSSKPYAIMGYATWESGLATAGTWSGAPTRVQKFGPSVPLPGATLREWSASSSTNDSTASLTFVNSSLAVSVTLSSAANKVAAFAYGMLANDALGVSYAQIQRGGSGVGAIITGFVSSGGGIGGGCPLGGDDFPGTVASTAYTVAIKASASNARWVGAAGGSSGIKAVELMT